MAKTKVIRKMTTLIVSASLVLGMTGVEGKSAKAASKKSPKKITVSVSKKVLYVGGDASQAKAVIKAKVKPAKASQKLKFKSSNKKVLSVNNKGKVIAREKGTAIVTVSSKIKPSIKKKIKFQVKKLNNSSGDVVSSKPVETVTPVATDQPVKSAIPMVQPTRIPGVVIEDDSPETIYLKGTESTTEATLTWEGHDIDLSKVDSYTSSNTDVADIDADGTVTAKKMGRTVIIAKLQDGSQRMHNVYVKQQDISIHDPSVYRDPISGKYYTFGSHLRAAVSTNLIGWEWAANSSVGYGEGNLLFTKNYKEEFAEPYAFTMPDGANENAWAPDIVYNTSMKKYCMYMSIVDGNKKCCIAMASSDNPDGPYAYQGMIVCSSITAEDIEKTNVAEALGITEEEAKFSKYAALSYNSPDTIDANVFYDHSGNLWMLYGSFTTLGGIRLIKLDPDTGLRGENYVETEGTAEDKLAVSDPYYGLKIGNNNGEGPFIQEIPSEKSSTGYYYFLWWSQGRLQSHGSYNMRLFRSEHVEGPYKDMMGNAAVKSKLKPKCGVRVMDDYQFSFMDVGYVSCGGNSATMDETGKTFLHFHQKYANDTEDYTIRTHQTFMNEDGWLVTAPFEYNGETIADSYDISEVIGDYEFIYHRVTFDTEKKEYDNVTSEKITLNSDGTLSGAYEGTWSMNGHYVTIQINGQTYKGVFLEQSEQTEEREEAMVFTAIGDDNRSLWGCHIY